jgi:hypothetical protein
MISEDSLHLQRISPGEQHGRSSGWSGGDTGNWLGWAWAYVCLPRLTVFTVFNQEIAELTVLTVFDQELTELGQSLTQELPDDQRALFGRLPLTVDRFGKPLSQGPVVVDPGEPEVGEGKPAELADRFVGST